MNWEVIIGLGVPGAGAVILLVHKLTKIDTKLDGVVVRLGNVETRLDRVESRLDQVEIRLGTLEKHFYRRHHKKHK